MHYALEALKEGRDWPAAAFAAAEAYWTNVLADIDNVSDQTLEERFGPAQYQIEIIFGDRDRGKEAMGWSVMLHFWSTRTGFDNQRERALRVLRLMRASRQVSIEVHSSVKAAAKYLWLTEDD